MRCRASSIHRSASAALWPRYLNRKRRPSACSAVTVATQVRGAIVEFQISMSRSAVSQPSRVCTAPAPDRLASVDSAARARLASVRAPPPSGTPRRSFGIRRSTRTSRVPCRLAPSQKYEISTSCARLLQEAIGDGQKFWLDCSLLDGVLGNRLEDLKFIFSEGQLRYRLILVWHFFHARISKVRGPSA